MEEMIDRDDERARLVEAADQAPQLVVLRGRRRIGKSFLIDRSLEGKRQVSFQADEQDERGHLDVLAQETARLIPGNPPLLFSDWDAAFDFFVGLAEQEPLALVLDEFQWVVQAQPALPSILQRHWDRWHRAGMPLTVILSGSALTLMEQLLAHSSPLYGRANYRLLVQPLDYSLTAGFARADVNPETLLQRYAVFGGTPQYQVWAGKGSLVSIIRNRVLTKGEALYEEPLHLLREEQKIRDPGTYFAVLRAISGGAAQFNEIEQQARVESNLHVMLDRLEELGYIEKRLPVDVTSKKSRSTYRIADPFFRFWFRYVFPNRSRLERARVDEVLKEIEADLDNFMGLAFEDCCRNWVGRYAHSDRLPSSEILGSWWSRDGGVEVDVVGMSKGRYDLLGSCKWSTRVKASAIGELLDHRDHLGGKASTAQLVLFARGFKDDAIERAEEEGITLVRAVDLF